MWTEDKSEEGERALVSAAASGAAAGGLCVMRRIKLLLKDNNISKKLLGSSGKMPLLSTVIPPPPIGLSLLCLPLSLLRGSQMKIAVARPCFILFGFGSLMLKLGRNPLFSVWPPFK